LLSCKDSNGNTLGAVSGTGYVGGDASDLSGGDNPSVRAHTLKANDGGGNGVPVQPATITLTVSGGGATQSGVTASTVADTTNWAVLKGTTGATVTVTASVTPSGTPITWSTGTPVAGNPLAVTIPISTSAETPVTATGGGGTATVDIWILWSTVSIQFSENPPANAPQPQATYPNLPNSLGPHIDTSVTPNLQYGFYMATGQLTPSGAGAIVPTGWTLNREKIIYDKYGTGNYAGTDPTSPAWSGDTSNVASCIDFTPNADCIYDFDAPSQGADSSANSSPDTILYDFTEWVEWNGQPASDQGDAGENLHYESTWTSPGGFGTGDVSAGWLAALYGSGLPTVSYGG